MDNSNYAALRNKKKQRRASQKFNPLAYGEVIDFNEIPFAMAAANNLEVDEDLAETTSIVDKLQSFDPQTREMATISLAQIDQITEDFVKFLHEKGTFKLLVQRLVDPNPQVILHTLMAFTNIVESGHTINGKSVGDIILESGIIIFLESMLTEFRTAHENRQIDPNSNNFVVKIAIVDQSYKLLSSLSEVINEENVDMLLNSKVTSTSLYFLMHCDESRILTGISSYLQILTEISLKLCQQVSQNIEFLQRLVVITESNFASQELKAYILGSLYNYICTLERNNIQPEGVQELSEKVMMGIMSILSVKIFEEVENLLKIFEDNKRRLSGKGGNAQEGEPINHDEEQGGEETKENNNKVDSSDSIYDVRLKQGLSIWGDSASAIQICLGIIINLFESQETFEEDWQDENEDEDDQQNPKLSKYEPPRTTFMNNMTQELREKILGCVIDKCTHVKGDAYVDFLSSLRPVTEQSRKIIEFAFPAVMNILLNIEYTDKKSGTKYVDTVAEQLLKICLDEWKYYLEILYNNNTDDNTEDSSDKEEVNFEQNIINDILKITTHLLQNSSQNLAASINISDLLQVQSKTFGLLSQESRLATIELIGTRCHPKYNLTVEENAAVADVLLELLQSDDVMVIGEALNALFDVYSEEKYDEVFVQKGFVNVLDYGFNVFKDKIAENRDSLSREDYLLLKNHLLNLKRFIKYKKEHINQ